MSSSQIKRISFNQVNVPNLGSLKGVSDNRSHTIRYFDIPIGSIPRRWEKAIPVEPWEGVLDVATPKVFTSDEDEERNSLCGSVFVPNIRSFKNNNLFPGATHRFPVLVVVSNSVSDCSDIVETSIEQERPIIAVKLYHRTGHLGFLASKELALETWSHAQDIIKDEMNWDEGSFGNWGLLDLILGLQWIQTHIHAFGGDCNRVTVMGGPKDEVGESAVIYLQQIKGCRGLFTRSILHCCGSANLLPHLQPHIEGQIHFDYLCESFKVPKSLSPFEKVEMLRKVSTNDLTRVATKSPIAFFGPTVDNVIFHEDPRASIGNSTNIISGLEWVLSGTSTYNATNIGSHIGAVNMSAFTTFKHRICSSRDSDLFDRVYKPPKSNSEAKALAAYILNRGAFHYSAVRIKNAILTHPTCQISRYNIDRDVDILNRSSLAGSKPHPRDRRKIRSDIEYRKRIYQVWVEFATALSANASHLLKMSRSDDIQSLVAVEGTRIVGKDVIERISEEEESLWKQSFECYSYSESDYWDEQVENMTSSFDLSQQVEEERFSRRSSILSSSSSSLLSSALPSSQSPPLESSSSSMISTVLTAVVDVITFLRF